jgi:DNA-binding MarR family transcriptional regulator
MASNASASRPDARSPAPRRVRSAVAIRPPGAPRGRETGDGSADEGAAGDGTGDWASQLALTDIGLVARVLRLNMLVGRVLDDIAESAGVTAADHLVLGVLRHSPGRRSTPTRICEILWRSTGGMTLTIDRLVAAGWVEREPDPEDRRRIVVALTPAGLAVTTKVNDALHAWEHGLDLDPGRRDEIVHVVDELLGPLERAATRP